MSGSNSLQNKASPVKAILVVISVLILVSGTYFLTNYSNKNQNQDQAAAIENAGELDQNQNIENVADVEKVIAKWIENNPEAVIESIMKMQQKAAEQQQTGARETISSKMNELFNDSNSPTFSPENYDISIVEFFDYNCGYCKRAQETVEKLTASDKKVRIIYKEYPILGPSSEELSKVALAVNLVNSNKYSEFHDKLMKSSARNTDQALKVAAEVGLDINKIKETLESKKDQIASQIASNRKLASDLGINGTPAFIIGEELIPGAVDVSVLKDKIASIRSK